MKMNVSKSAFVHSDEMSLLAYRGDLFAVTEVHKAKRIYVVRAHRKRREVERACWHVYIRFGEPILDKVIILNTNPVRDVVMRRMQRQIRVHSSIDNMALQYYRRAFLIVGKTDWRKPKTWDEVWFRQ